MSCRKEGGDGTLRGCACGGLATRKEGLTISPKREIVIVMKAVLTDSTHHVVRALAHPARVRIVRELSGGGEKCVCELVEACGQGWSTVSRHLSVLRESGIIADEKRGLQVFYRLRLSCVARFIDCLDDPRRYPELQVEAACCC